MTIPTGLKIFILILIIRYTQSVIGLVSVYIMVKVTAGKDKEVFAKIQKLKEIKEANVTYGAYDLILRVEFSTIEDVDEFVFNVVRRIPGVSETVSMIVAKRIV